MVTTFSKIITKREICLINKYINQYLLNSNNPNIKYFYKTSKYTISIYKNNRIFIQGNNYDWVLTILKGSSNIVKNEDSGIKIDKYIGSDESGTGDFFGGITVASAYVKINNLEKINDFNIRDSKKISDKEIYILVEKLKHYCEYEIISIDANEYNKRYLIHNNIKKILALMHLEAIEKLSNRIEIKDVIIDQFVSKTVFNKYVENLESNKNLNIYFETKSESKYLNVAIASIYARWAFLQQIKKINKEYNTNIPLGSSNPYIISFSNRFLKNKKIDLFVKKNFKTVDKINFK
ncbi:MAG: ribonuclease HIII [Mycoplasmoidaceae bacterium]